MRKLLNKPWFAGLLALAALALVGQAVYPYVKSPAVIPENASPEAAPEVVAEQAPQTQTTSGLLTLPKFDSSLRDPFPARIAVVDTVSQRSKDPLPDLLDTVRLGALWAQDGKVFALVNGEVVSEGSQIGRLTLESVNINGVWLRHWRGRNFLELGNEFTLATPATNPNAVLPSASKS